MSDELNILREKISVLDEQILKLLAERVTVAREIGKIKRGYGKPITDREREKQVYAKVRTHAEKLGLNPEDCEQVFKKIVKMCKRVQYML
ncbi:MAG: chorismate mutase [Nitrososphaeria archaeon]